MLLAARQATAVLIAYSEERSDEGTLVKLGAHQDPSPPPRLTPNLEKPLPEAYNAVARRIWMHKPLFSGYVIPRQVYRRGILRSAVSNPRLSAKEPPRCRIPSSLRSFGTTFTVIPSAARDPASHHLGPGVPR